MDDAKFNTSDTKRDKIFMLFMLWQSANSAGDSMAKLLTHLREQLKDASVDNIIKKYGKSNHITIVYCNNMHN